MNGISKRTGELLSKFRLRLSVTPFTIDGIPSAEEVNLTKDIWNSLSDSERTKICDNIMADFTQKYGIKKNLPDPTPYAMRLAHRYLDVMRKEPGVSASYSPAAAFGQ